MKIEKLTEEERDRLTFSYECPESKALCIIDAQAERIASLERQVESWERGHDYAWSEKQRAERCLSDAENEMRRIGYGEELIYCFDADGKPTHTSHVGDLCWDTRENRARTFQFISDTLERDHVATGASARTEHLQVHGLDPAEIEVDAMFQGAE